MCNEKGQREEGTEGQRARRPRFHFVPLSLSPFVPELHIALQSRPMCLFTKKPGNFYVSHNSTITGDVKIGEFASVWFNAVIRGDVAPVTIGRQTNVQDGAVVHC